MARFETPSADIVQLRAGHFRRRAEYGIYRTRGTPNHLLIYTRSGAGRFQHARGEVVTSPGDVVLLEPGALHDYGTAPGVGHWELLWTHFHPQAGWYEWLKLPLLAPGFRHLSLQNPEHRTRAEDAFLEMERLRAGAFRHNENLAMNKLAEALLWCDLENPNLIEHQIDARVKKAQQLIEANLKHALALGELAKRCGLSRSRFAALFRAEAGTTPQRYQEALRIARARELLEISEASITEIAESLGFTNRFYFSFRFKRKLGTSPRTYRESHRRAR